MAMLQRSSLIGILCFINMMSTIGRVSGTTGLSLFQRNRWSASAFVTVATRVDRSHPLHSTKDQPFHSTTNAQIVARRNEINRAKREARQKVLDKDRERNYRLRTLFSQEGQQQQNVENGAAGSDDGSGVPPMFAIKLVTDRTLRTELKMNGREKRGRMFVKRPPSSVHSEEEEEYACTSLKALRQTIHEFFRRLKKSTYLLSASLPVLDEEGHVLMYDTDDEDHQVEGTWSLNTDADVQHAFREAEKFFIEQQTDGQGGMKRPTLILYVTKDPNAPLPPPPPPYLENMPDPNSSPTMTMLSFYAFPPNEGIVDPESTADQLKRLWRPFRALGRVYVANEGVNAQMAVPTNVLPNFLQCNTLSPEEGGELSHVLGSYMENGINIDPIPVDMQEFQSNPAFKNLHIRVRSQIVADGFDKPLDWQSAGYDMPPLEWHEKLKEARGKVGEDGKAVPIVFDCRNDYETQVGKFELAEPLQTENFRDSWDVLKERLKDTPKDTPIMTYCTGGIRCVKVNAYLTQELEFTNVSRLAGGIIGYDRTLSEQAPTEEPMFKGTNYVFDGRMGRRITNDQLGTCLTCGSKTHLVSNCKNENCHKRMVQCEYCRDSFFGTCSEGCKTRVVNSGSTHAASKQLEQNEAKVYTNLDEYSTGHSSQTSPLLNEFELNTKAFMPTGAHMVSGATQGTFLKMLASMTREGRILEIGTFSGYATACFLEGAAIAGKLSGNVKIGSSTGGGPFVMSLERDRRALGLAAAHLKVMSEHGMSGIAAEHAAKLRETKGTVRDFDGESATYVYDNIASCELRRVNDALATVEEMIADTSPDAVKPFDVVFVDADKTRLMEYVDALVSNDRILKKGGLIVVDNVLWKGLVLDAITGYDSESDGELSADSDSSSQSEKELLRKNRRARKLANKMHRFNSAVVQDDRVEVLLMPLRDGLSLIRKK